MQEGRKCKMNKIKCLLLALVLLFSLSACGRSEKVSIKPMEADEVYAVAIEPIGGKDVMPISGFYGPIPVERSLNGETFPSQYSDEIFQLIADCGVNMMHYYETDYAQEPELIRTMLDQGEKFGIGICVVDQEIWYRGGEDSLSLKDLDERINEYSNHPAFAGVYVTDEPSTSYFYAGDNREIAFYAETFKNLNELGIFGAGNLFPVYDKEEYEVYKRYVDEWIEVCNPPMVSFDNYLWDQGRRKDDWFYNVDVVRAAAEKNGKPFWLYVQAGGQWGLEANDSGPLYPSEGQFHWNVNMSLALGTKGIEYYTLIAPIFDSEAKSTPYDFQRQGLLGAWGNKTQWWYYAKDVNAQIAAVDHVLMNSSSKGVLVSGKNAQKDTKGCEFLLEGTSWRELKSIEGDALVGCFNFQGKTALYVVNYDEEYAQKITLNLHDTYKLQMIQNAKEKRLETNQLILDLKAGEGALLVFE